LNWGDVEEISVEMQRAHRVADPDDPVRVTIGELLRRTAARIPTRTVLIEGAPDSKTRRRVSYSKLLTVAEAGARDLLRRFPKGGNIAISASNSIDWIVLEFSAALAGLPLVMINLSLTGHEVEYIHKARTVGKPLPGIELKIVSVETGEITGVDEHGEICVRDAGRINEYFDMAEATALTIDKDGWLHTGDIGTLAADGYCAITGRLKDMIRRGGINIYSREIEDVLVTHTAIAEAVAFGIPDNHWGEQVAVSVRLRRSAATPSIAELKTFLREHIARHKVPKFWEFVARQSKEGSNVH
jgi:acyl-CoA synthetase (AMP-forming)/AMP-acid ligase II